MIFKLIQRFKLLIILGGTALAHAGYEEYELNQNNSMELSTIELASLEEGEKPKSSFIEIEDCVPVYEELFISYKTSKWGKRN